MGTHSEKAACVGGPIAAADVTGITGVHRYAATGASQSVALPLEAANPQKKSTLAGRFLSIRPVGCTIQWAQGRGAAPTIASNATAAFGTGGATVGSSLADGEEKQIVVDPLTTHIGLIANGASGYIEFYMAETSGRP